MEQWGNLDNAPSRAARLSVGDRYAQHIARWDAGNVAKRALHAGPYAAVKAIH